MFPTEFLSSLNLSACLTEKIESSQQGHNRQHNDGNSSFLGSLLVLPVELSNGIGG